jgi:hypothetical protein
VWGVFVCFVDIGEIVDNYCLDFLFITEWSFVWNPSPLIIRFEMKTKIQTIKNQHSFASNKKIILYNQKKQKKISCIFSHSFYTDLSCLGGVFAKNTCRETKNFPIWKAREI